MRGNYRYLYERVRRTSTHTYIECASLEVAEYRAGHAERDERERVADQVDEEGVVFGQPGVVAREEDRLVGDGLALGVVGLDRPLAVGATKARGIRWKTG